MRVRFAAIDFVGNDRRGAAPGEPAAERRTIVSLEEIQDIVLAANLTLRKCLGGFKEKI